MIGCVVLVFLSHWLLVRKRCDSEQKIVRFVNKSYCREPVRLQGSPAISKWISYGFHMDFSSRILLVLKRRQTKNSPLR